MVKCSSFLSPWVGWCWDICFELALRVFRGGDQEPCPPWWPSRKTNLVFASFPFLSFWLSYFVGNSSKQTAYVQVLNWDLLLGKANLKQNLRWPWWETDVGTCLNSSSLDWRRKFFICHTFLLFPWCRDIGALESRWKPETQGVTKHGPCLPPPTPAFFGCAYCVVF